MAEPFLVVGTPRSRTAWLARFLSTPGRECLHEPSLLFDQPEDLDAFLANDTAAASDSMMTFLAPRARSLRPGCTIVVVRRPLGEVHASFARLRLEIPAWFLEMLDRRALEVSENFADLRVSYEDLGKKEVCAAIFKACTGCEFDEDRWERLKHQNIQRDIVAGLNLLRDRFDAHARVFGPHYDPH